MKSLLSSAMVLCFSLASFSQSLEVTGNFDSTHAVYNQNSSRRVCHAHGGHMTHKGCATKAYDKVEITREDNGDLTVGILAVNENGKRCKYVGPAEMMANGVQLIVKQNDCDIVVGFQNNKTLSVMTSDTLTCEIALLEAGICQTGAKIEINNLIRLK